MPEMRSLMKQAAQLGDNTTVTAIAREMEETFGEYQNGLSSIERKRRMELTSRVGKSRAHASSGISKGVRKGLGLGLNPPLSLLFYKTLLPAQRRLLFSHTFCLLICRLNVLMQIPRNEFACKFQGTL